MLKAKPGKQLLVQVSNDIGVLADLSRLLSDKGVNILALDGWGEGGSGEVRIVTDDDVRAADALKKQGYTVVEQNAVLLDARHKPGILHRLTETLARERIDVQRIYAGAGLDQDRCLVVLDTSDNDRATVLLND